MADVFSILSANYKTVGTDRSVEDAVCRRRSRRSIEGNWTGKYADNKSFKVTVSNVTGFRAKVQYQSGSTNKYAGRSDQGQCVSDRRYEIHG